MGKYPGLPNIFVPLVDVRDVAEAHIKALNEDVETGRYIVSNRKHGFIIYIAESYEFVKVGENIAKEFSSFGYEPSQRKLGYCTAKVASWFVPEAKSLLKQWGKKISVSNAKSKEHLNIAYTDIFDRSLIDMCNSLIENGYVPDLRVMD